MTLNLQLPTQELTMRPVITVVGVGGAGGNAVNNMISAQLEGVQFVVANTDAQALESALTERTIQLGRTITQGLGAGATPEIGQAAAEEAAQDIASCIDGSHMVFITAGMGGGTGTGAAPVVARMAREQGMLTVGVVTKPFQFEGGKRMRIAEQGIAELQKYVDTLIVIPNQNLFRIANEKTTFADAFRMADEVLHSGVRGVTDLMVKPGLVNLDFADIRTVMQEMGKAMMGTGEATGEKRAIEAAEAAISNPLLDDVSLKGARAALINITGGMDMTLYEVDEAANRIREEIDNDANIIFGSTFNQAMDGTIRVSVVATGIDSDPEQLQQHIAAGGAASRNFTKPSAAKPSYKPTSAYYVGRKPTTNPVGQPAIQAGAAFNPSQPSQQQSSVTASGGHQHQAQQSSVMQQQPAMRPQMRPAPVAAQESSFQNRAEQHFQRDVTAPSAHMQHYPSPASSAASHQQPKQIPPVAARNYGAEQSHVPQEYEGETENPGPLFVNPSAGQPASRQFQQRTEKEAEAYEDEQTGSSSFKILSRIADVGRSFNARTEQPVATARSFEVKDRREQQAEQPQESFEDYKEHEEESYYDIPAFLRRQNNPN